MLSTSGFCETAINQSIDVSGTLFPQAVMGQLCYDASNVGLQLWGDDWCVQGACYDQYLLLVDFSS
jgi:hypothetical protein